MISLIFSRPSESRYLHRVRLLSRPLPSVYLFRHRILVVPAAPDIARVTPSVDRVPRTMRRENHQSDQFQSPPPTLGIHGDFTRAGANRLTPAHTFYASMINDF
jgi:hypothetical protein